MASGRLMHRAAAILQAATVLLVRRLLAAGAHREALHREVHRPEVMVRRVRHPEATVRRVRHPEATVRRVRHPEATVRQVRHPEATVRQVRHPEATVRQVGAMVRQVAPRLTGVASCRRTSRLARRRPAMARGSKPPKRSLSVGPRSPRTLAAWRSRSRSVVSSLHCRAAWSAGYVAA